MGGNTPAWSWMTLGGGVLLVLRIQIRYFRVMSRDTLLYADIMRAARAPVAIWNGIVSLSTCLLSVPAYLLRMNVNLF